MLYLLFTDMEMYLSLQYPGQEFFVAAWHMCPSHLSLGF